MHVSIYTFNVYFSIRIETHICIYIYIFIKRLAWTCAYPCTEDCGSDDVVALQWCCQSGGLSSVLSLYFVLRLVFPGLDLFGEADPPGTLTCQRALKN